jgi:hypothetical protein
MTLRSFLDVSSGHLSPETWKWLDDQFADSVLRDPRSEGAARIAGGKTRYGWLVYAPEGITDGVPEHLTLALLAAREQGVEYILFDCDAPLDENLPIRHPDCQCGTQPVLVRESHPRSRRRLMRRKQSRAQCDPIEERIRKAGTIGTLERLAGVGPDPQSRTNFWLNYTRLSGDSGLNAGIEALKQRARARAAVAEANNAEGARDMPIPRRGRAR